MPQSTISAELLDPSAKLTDHETISVTETFATDLVDSLDAKTFTHGESQNSKKNYFNQAVELEISFLISDEDEMYEWWVEVNTSEPEGDVWATSTTKFYAHPRRLGAVIGVEGTGGQVRYLEISVPQ